MLIQNAEIWRGGPADIRIEARRVAALGALEPRAGEAVLNAHGGALLPGLHDHHIHLAALAAQRNSIPCGPPQVNSGHELVDALSTAGQGWLRGVGYHESVAGMLDAAALDAMQMERPVRLQHRSGRMWFLNTRAIDLLLAETPPPPGLERDGGRYTGRLFDSDAWLQTALKSSPPDFTRVSAELAQWGVTGITDMTPANDPRTAAHFAQQQAAGALLQSCLLAGSAKLPEATFSTCLRLGPAKLHLHDAQLPAWDDALRFVIDAHAQRRAVAVHCVTETELVFALAILTEAGLHPGDRIEHASVAPDHLVAAIGDAGLRVTVQPHFIAERGDQYLAEVDAEDHASLYRLRAFHDAGIPMAGGSDAPYGDADPWAAMRAAVRRETPSKRKISPDEALTPEQAIALFLAHAEEFTREKKISPGAVADLVLLDRPWKEARERLSAGDVRMTVIGGSIVYNRVDQAPFQSGSGADARAGQHHQRGSLAADPS